MTAQRPGQMASLKRYSSSWYSSNECGCRTTTIRRRKQNKKLERTANRVRAICVYYYYCTVDASQPFHPARQLITPQASCQASSPEHLFTHDRKRCSVEARSSHADVPGAITALAKDASHGMYSERIISRLVPWFATATTVIFGHV